MHNYSRRIILFGSASRGENLPDSDIDLFIISNEPRKVRSILSAVPEIVPIVMSNPEFSNLKKTDPALYDQINRGLTLWEQNG
jgi:predicted nucleotidyltransferase